MQKEKSNQLTREIIFCDGTKCIKKDQNDQLVLNLVPAHIPYKMTFGY